MAPVTSTSTSTSRRTALEEERDLLLRSLDDLDAEHAAGDLDQDDYEALRDSYTQRAAEVLRQLEGPTPKASGTRASADRKGATAAPETATDPAGRPTRPRRRLLVLGGLAVFALIAGLALAQGLGERGVNDSLTGAVDPSSRTRVMECQAQGSGPEGDLLGAIKCFDQVLTVDPENAEALAYRGWYLLLAAGSVQQGGGPTDTVPPADIQALIDGGLDYLTRAIEADPTLPDPLAFRAVAYDRLGRSEEACADVAALKALNPPPFFLQQTSALAERNGC